MRVGADNITALVLRILDADDFFINSHRVKLVFDDGEQASPAGKDG